MSQFITNISLWGDSIVKGIIMNSIRNRYETLKSSAASQCARLLGIDIHNNARFGCTITKGSRLFHEALERGLDCDAVVLEFGGNDCDHNWAEVAANPIGLHDANTPIEIFRETYREMIQAIREHAFEPILMSLPPLHAKRYFDWITRTGLSRENILRYLGDVEHIYRFQERYSLAVCNLAIQLKCEFIDLREAFLAHFDYATLLCDDGIHPNEKGHAVMSEAIVAYATKRRASLAA